MAPLEWYLSQAASKITTGENSVRCSHTASSLTNSLNSLNRPGDPHEGVGWSSAAQHLLPTQAIAQQVALHFFLNFFFVEHFAIFSAHFFLRHFPFLSLPHWATGLGGGGELAYSCGACPKHIWYSPNPPGQASAVNFRPIWLHVCTELHASALQSFAEFAPVSLTQTAACPSEFWSIPGRLPAGHRAAQSGGGGRGGGGGGGGGGGSVGGVLGLAGGALGAPPGGYGGGGRGGFTGGGPAGGLKG